MSLKKWIAAVASSGALGMAALGGGVIGLVVIGVTGYNILMEPDKILGEEEEDIAKVHRLGYGECECNCVYIGEAGDTSGTGGGTSNGGGGNSSATSGGAVTFTGTEDKNDFTNCVFYFNKIVCDELGLPMWTLYAVNSGETGGSAYITGGVTWNGAYNGMDGSVALRFGSESAVRPSKKSGAAGFFQVQWDSIESEMGYMTKNFDKYQGIISKSGIDTNKYPGLQAGLEMEAEKGYVNWYQDCTYYPAAAINAAEALLERKQIAAEKNGWLKSFDWYNNASQSEKDVIDYYVALTLWNNGLYSIETEYVNRDLYGIYLEAFLYVIKNKSDEFFSQPYNKTTGNGAQDVYGPETEGNLEPTRWVLDHAPNITPEIRKRFEDEFIKPRLSGKDGWKNQYVKRFCCYSTNNIFNAMTESNQYSVINNLAQHGITITGGWSLLSDGNTSNLGENGSGGTTSSGGNSGGSSNVTLDANGISERVDNVIYVGDSRFVGMDSYTKKGGDFLVAKVSMGYSWFTSDAMSSIQSIKAANPNVKDWTIVSNLGVNDLYNINNYISKYQEMQNNGDNIIVVSVNPTDKSHSSLNSEIDDFNDKLKSSGLTYIDTNSVLKSDGFETSDGLHYKKDTYIKIWNEINKGLASSSGGSGGLSSSTRIPSKKINTANNNSERNNGGTGNLGSSGGTFTLGKLIADVSASPQGLPLYDNYTFDPNKYEYWDTNYEQFWDGTTPQDSPLYGLGDFVDHLGLQAVTSESSIRLPSNQTTKIAGASIYDGRIAFAIPTLVHQKPSENRDKFLALAKDPANYKGKDGKVELPTLPEQGLLTPAPGLYFDIVLDNGTVIPGIAGDAKGLHHGVATDGHYKGYWFGGIYCDGYAHLTFHATANNEKGELWSQSILENCGGGGNPAVKEMLKGHRIASIRSYDIHSNGAVNYQKYFTQGGSDSSFGLTGGSTNGGAKPGGTGNAALGGTGGGTTTTNNGLNPNDPNWKCDCDIPCSRCMCHDNGVGGKPVDSSGDTIGGGGVTNIGGDLQETIGTLQGIYCDLSGKQLTSEEVWAMLEAKAPIIAAEYKPHVGVAPKAKVTTRDKWRDMFGGMEGSMNYEQYQEPFRNVNHMWTNRSVDGFRNTPTGVESIQAEVGHACFRSSACGFCSLSIIASTMLHRYIDPPEIIIASYLSPDLNPEFRSGAFYSSNDNGNMLAYEGAHQALYAFRYKGQRLLTTEASSSLNQTKVNATLDAGGMVSVCVHGTGSTGATNTWTSQGHFIVIREHYTGDDGQERYLTVDSSHTEGSTGAGNVSVPHVWGEFVRDDPNQVNYVTPGPGYQDYINDMKNKNSGGTGSTGNLETGNGESSTTLDGVTITEHMLSNSSRYLDDIWRDSSGNIPTDAKVFVFKPKNPNGHSVTIDAGHGNNSHPSTSLPTESVFPGLTEQQIKSMKSSATGKSAGVEARGFKNVFNKSEIEPECTLAVAIKVRDKLLEKGYTVTMTRNLGTQNLSNGTRSVLGCETSEIYVAIHTNASDSGGRARGVISFYPGDGNNDPNDPRPGYTRLLGLDANKAESMRLAQELSYGVRDATPGLPLNGSGISEHVLRIFSYSNKPIALVELGFSDNMQDAQILIEKKEEMAQGIVNGIDKYFGY